MPRTSDLEVEVLIDANHTEKITQTGTTQTTITTRSLKSSTPAVNAARLS